MGNGIKGLREVKINNITSIFFVKKTSPVLSGDKKVRKAGFTFAETMLGLRNRIVVSEPIG